MKFYFKGKIVSTKDTPLIIILTMQDKKHIANMVPGVNVYCQYETDLYSIEEIDQLCTEAKEQNGNT